MEVLIISIQTYALNRCGLKKPVVIQIEMDGSPFLDIHPRNVNIICKQKAYINPASYIFLAYSRSQRLSSNSLFTASKLHLFSKAFLKISILFGSCFFLIYVIHSYLLSEIIKFYIIFEKCILCILQNACYNSWNISSK